MRYALKDLDCIAVQIKAYRPVRRIVYDNADWSAESRKLLRDSRDLRFEFRQFEPNSIERLIDIARASGSEVKIDTQQPLDPSKRSDEDRLRPRSVGQNNGVGHKSGAPGFLLFLRDPKRVFP